MNRESSNHTRALGQLVAEARGEDWTDEEPTAIVHVSRSNYPEKIAKAFAVVAKALPSKWSQVVALALVLGAALAAGYLFGR